MRLLNLSFGKKTKNYVKYKERWVLDGLRTIFYSKTLKISMPNISWLYLKIYKRLSDSTKGKVEKFRVPYQAYWMRPFFAGEPVPDFQVFLNRKRRKYKYITASLTRTIRSSFLMGEKTIFLYHRIILSKNMASNT
jgi:hypothetical protein